ncbi:MAG: hypothetical protein M3Y42_19260 [Actinomycetota bacterium]|nr:hypothetical protein [Actinomycetota bacterium]
MLILARPLDLPVEHEFGIGESMLVSWPDPTGITSATTELVESRLQGQIGLWVVRVLGDYRREQRRRYVRVPAVGPVRLSLIAAESGQPFGQVTGHLVRISEAALRCAVRVADAGDLAPELALVADFRLSGKEFTLAASVLKLEPCRHEKENLELVAVFQIDEDEAASLRRLVFAEQLRLRNG